MRTRSATRATAPTLPQTRACCRPATNCATISADGPSMRREISAGFGVCEDGVARLLRDHVDRSHDEEAGECAGTRTRRQSATPWCDGHGNSHRRPPCDRWTARLGSYKSMMAPRVSLDPPRKRRPGHLSAREYSSAMRSPTGSVKVRTSSTAFTTDSRSSRPPLVPSSEIAS